MISKQGVDLSVCAYCSVPIDNFSRTVDHLYPESKGGVRSNSNKVPACSNCNQLKGALDIDEFQKAVEVLIHHESVKHRQEVGKLKRIRYNIKRIIDERQTD